MSLNPADTALSSQNEPMPSDANTIHILYFSAKSQERYITIASLLYLSLDELLNDRIGVLRGGRLSSKVSCDSLALSNSLQRGVSVVPIAAGTKSLRTVRAARSILSAYSFRFMCLSRNKVNKERSAGPW